MINSHDYNHSNSNQRSIRRRMGWGAWFVSHSPVASKLVWFGMWGVGFRVGCCALGLRGWLGCFYGKADKDWMRTDQDTVVRRDQPVLCSTLQRYLNLLEFAT